MVIVRIDNENENENENANKPPLSVSWLAKCSALRTESDNGV